MMLAQWKRELDLTNCAVRDWLQHLENSSLSFLGIPKACQEVHVLNVSVEDGE